ncbi:hypothetical protein STRIP9103_00225 [Streptomyces ipomoeae 91-03]|uniref:Uncharacterized protein n=1 Tax=Streptomyces ipomoeae 91-03 TaxID=698759 RepID=L1KPR1_9ACTN|nr:hypothetical protein STRIP9103_00225 [Streptomyces ipomoeae 91-03]
MSRHRTTQPARTGLPPLPPGGADPGSLLGAPTSAAGDVDVLGFRPHAESTPPAPPRADA